jgi:hypothetical protein
MGVIYEVYRWDFLEWHDRSFIKIGSGVQVILRLLSKKIERLQSWYQWWEGIMKYAVDMASDRMKYVRSFTTIGFDIQVTLRLLPQQFERL